jgi:hypothetical protein
MSNSTESTSGGAGAAAAKDIVTNQAIGTGGVVAPRPAVEYSLVERVIPPLPGAVAAPRAGGAAKFHDSGGPVLSSARVQLVFWGQPWGNVPPPTPSAVQVANAASNIMNGPYLSALAQYRSTIGPASVRGTTLVTSSNPPNPFSDQNVVNLISGLLDNGTLPNPLVESVLFAVIVPKGVSNTGSGFIGEHSYFTYNAHLPGPFPVTVPVRVHYAWVTNGGTLDSVTPIFSHELVESITDPEGSAILGNAGVCNQGGWCEIGDVCSSTGRINGVLVQSYWSDADSACIIPDGMVAGPVSGDPVLIQSRFGTKGNFEVVVPRPTGGLAHYWRNDDDAFLNWNGPTVFGAAGKYSAVTMIQSNYGTPGNLEAVAVQGSNLMAFWRDSGPAFNWNGPANIGGGVAGIPAMIQSRFGAKGNFELAVPSAQAGIVFQWRNNDDPSMPWSGQTVFGQSLGKVSAVTVIQSNYGNPGNLELMALAGSDLYFFWRDSGPAFNWNGPYHIASGISGNASLIQSRFGTKGNFEMVVPLVSGGMAHFWRNNDNPAMPWSGPTPFGGSVGHVDDCCVIESNFGSPGNLEVAARIGSRMAHFWRDSGPAFNWNGPIWVTR